MSSPQSRPLAAITRANGMLASITRRYAAPVVYRAQIHSAIWLFKGVKQGLESLGADVNALMLPVSKGLARCYATRVQLLSENDPHTARGSTFVKLLQALKQWSNHDTTATSIDITICLLRYIKAVVTASLNRQDKMDRLRKLDARVQEAILSTCESKLVVVRLSITALLLQMALNDVAHCVQREHLKPRAWLKGTPPSVFPPDYQPKLLTSLMVDLDRYARTSSGHRLKRGDGFWSQATAVCNSQWQGMPGGEAIKAYRAALVLVTGKHYAYELEGILYVRLARCHEKLTSGDVQAVAYYKKAIAHAKARRPFLTNEGWYRVAELALKARRDAELAKKKTTQKPANASVQNFEKLKHQFETLDGKKMPLKHFLEHIFAKFPPRSPGPESFKEQVKGNVTRLEVLKIIARYHPDHNRVYGADWHFVCEEITKRLNSKKDAFASGNADATK